jgi:K+-sensing histidine kinase KdpD
VVATDETVTMKIGSNHDHIRIEITAPGLFDQTFGTNNFFESYRTGEKTSRPARMKVSLSKGILRAHQGSLDAKENDGLTQISISIATVSNSDTRAIAA